MYRASEGRLKIEAFERPFGGSLDPENRRVKLSRLVPWRETEKLYADRFPKSGRGRPAFSVRVALGSPLVKERQGFSDEELAESVRENPYLQSFIGFGEHRNERPFHPALLVDFRKRLAPLVPRINELIALSHARREGEKNAEADKGDDNPPPGGSPAPPNRGNLLLDATRAPADVAYPADLKLVDAAREKTEEIVDRLRAPLRGEARKPRTCRKKARRLFHFSPPFEKRAKRFRHPQGLQKAAKFSEAESPTHRRVVPKDPALGFAPQTVQGPSGRLRNPSPTTPDEPDRLPPNRRPNRKPFPAPRSPRRPGKSLRPRSSAPKSP